MTLNRYQVASLKRQLDRQKRRGKPQGTVEGVEQSKANAALYYRNLLVIVDDLERATLDVMLPALEVYEKQRLLDADMAIDALIEQALALFSSYRNWEKYADEIATKAATVEGAHNRKAFIASIEAAIGVNIQDILSESSVRIPVEKSIVSNLDLIETIPKQYVERLKKEMLLSVSQGGSAFDLQSAILKNTDVTRSRARLIARDQMAKLNGALNRSQQEDIGVTGYRWRTSSDERVRKSHARNDGRQFDWDNPPPNTGHPGHDVQCRCTADPDLSPLLGVLANR
jgi:SPP1 gp7 family putative phage head morphogenesis protein